MTEMLLIDRSFFSHRKLSSLLYLLSVDTRYHGIPQTEKKTIGKHLRLYAYNAITAGKLATLDFLVKTEECLVQERQN